MNKNKQILHGMCAQNDPAEYNGKTGFWCQADCVFVEADSPTEAILLYRNDFENARIGVSHNHNTDAICYLKRKYENFDKKVIIVKGRKRLHRLEQIAYEIVSQLFDSIDLGGWQKLVVEKTEGIKQTTFDRLVNYMKSHNRKFYVANALRKFNRMHEANLGFQHMPKKIMRGSGVSIDEQELQELDELDLKENL